jgi:hypothetical protein
MGVLEFYSEHESRYSGGAIYTDPFTVSSAGFGKDIWTIPFDDITLIVKVRRHNFGGLKAPY